MQIVFVASTFAVRQPVSRFSRNGRGRAHHPNSVEDVSFSSCARNAPGASVGKVKSRSGLWNRRPFFGIVFRRRDLVVQLKRSRDESHLNPHPCPCAG
jgi:hypothetical protein